MFAFLASIAVAEVSEMAPADSKAGRETVPVTLLAVKLARVLIAPAAVKVPKVLSLGAETEVALVSAIAAEDAVNSGNEGIVSTDKVIPATVASFVRVLLEAFDVKEPVICVHEP